MVGPAELRRAAGGFRRDVAGVTGVTCAAPSPPGVPAGDTGTGRPPIMPDPQRGARRRPSAMPEVRPTLRAAGAWIALVLAGAVCIGTASAAAVGNPRAARFYEDALKRYQEQDYAGAAIQLRNALSIERDMLAVQLLLGKSLMGTQDVAAAEVAFMEALRLGVDRAEVVVPLAHALVAQGKQAQVIGHERFSPSGLAAGVRQQLLLVRAAAYADLGDLRRGLQSIDEARAIAPTAPEVWLAEVPMRIRTGELDAAAAAAERALALAPTLAEAAYLRGTVHHQTGNLQAARSMYDRALQADSKHVEALVSRAGLLLDLERAADAARDIDALLKAAPRDPRGLFLRAQEAARRGDATVAQAALHGVTGLLDPVPPDYLRYRPQLLMLGGLAHHGLGQFEKARPYLEAVLRLQPGNPVAKILARIQLDDNATGRAIETLQAYLRARPGDVQGMHLLASAHMSQGRHQQAAQILQEALRVDDDPRLRTALGLSLVGSGRIADALAELEAAWRREPPQAAAGTALASLYLQAEQPQRAAGIARRLVAMNPNQASYQHLLGSALALAGDAAGARAALERATVLAPDFVSPQVELARLDLRTGEAERALQRLTALLRSNERDSVVLGEIARVHEARGRFADARIHYEKAEDHGAAGDIAPGVALVDFLLRQGQTDAAREATGRLINKAPEALPVLTTVARVHLALGDATGARARLTRAAVVAGFDAPQLVRVALLQRQAGDIGGAAHSVGKALDARPDYLPALALMADIEIARGELGRAEQLARRLVAADAKLGVGHAVLGDIAMARRQLPAAAEHYGRAHRIESSGESLLRLYRAVAAGDAAAGQRLLDGWLRQHPGDVRVRRALAEAHARAGRWPDARAAYETLLRATPDDAEALNNLANVLIELGDFDAAVRTAERALSLRPGVAPMIGTLGWAAFKAGQPERALQLLRDARLREPGNPDTRYLLAEVLAAAGRRAEAREELAAALQLARPFTLREAAQNLAKALE